jgi:hypothetical protein
MLIFMPSTVTLSATSARTADNERKDEEKK